MHKHLLVSALLAAWLILAGSSSAQEKAKSDLTVLVPERGHKETVVTLNGAPTKQTGGTRKFVTPELDKGQPYTYVVEAIIEPNNYTKITRTKKVTFKAGDPIVVDLRNEDLKNDKIVVRWVPTPDDIVDKMSEMAKCGKDDIVYDLGCGDAVMLIRPIKKFGAKKGVGIDIDEKMVVKAKEKAKAEGVSDKVLIRKGDILNVDDMKDLAEATVVLLYIGDDLGKRLEPVLQKNLKPGTRVVSHRFTLGDWRPTETKTVTGEDGSEYVLHLWIAGEKK